MNVNYPGSLAERKLQFSSVVDVQNISNNDLFNALSIYMPLSFAESNLVGFAAAVEPNAPALIALTVDNYQTEATGALFSQILPLFADGTNSDLTIYVIVFYDTDGAPTMWVKGIDYITFEPLTFAFQQLYFLSFMKTLFDPDYDGSAVTIPGTPSTMDITLLNSGGSSKTLAAGTYTFTDGDKTWGFTLQTATIIGPGASLVGIVATATTTGTTTATAADALTYASFTPNLDAAFTVDITVVVQGGAPVTRASTYFALALALAYQAKTNLKLSVVFSLVQLDWSLIDTNALTDTNPCKIRAQSVAQEAAAMQDISSDDLTANFYGALCLMKAENTCVLVDCDPTRNLFMLILQAWFVAKNPSGEYVGNKLSLLRISGQNCFGPVSPINGAFNAADGVGYDIFDSKNVGCLAPISGSNNGDSYLSMCRGVTGIPVGAMMIAKFADYQSGQDCADLITDTGTLTNPVLTNEGAGQDDPEYLHR